MFYDLESFFVRNILLSITLFSFFAAQASQPEASQKILLCAIDALGTHCQKEIDTFIPDKLLIESIDYFIDPGHDQEELLSITGLRSNKLTTKKDLECAVFYLKQMGVFKKIILKIFQHKKIDQAPAYSFEFFLEKHYLFSQLTISGPLRSKEHYKNAYLIEIGDIFDEQKHQHSLQNIHKTLQTNGYFSAQLLDKITYNKENSSVFVQLLLKKGKRFTINKINCMVQDSHHISKLDAQKICQKTVELCSQKAQAKHYGQELIKSMRHKIKSLLEQKGFIVFNVEIEEIVQLESKTIDLDIKIIIDRKKEFSFLGNVFFNHQELMNHLLLYGKSAWHFPSSVIIDEIEQMYKSKGFWSVKISVREEKNKVYCLIKEGKRTIISSIKINDQRSLENKALDHETLDSDILHEPRLIKSNFSQLLKSKFFDKDLLKKSIDQLIKAYRQSGFWDAKITKEQFVKTKEDKYNHCQLVLNIELGRKRIMGSSTILQHANIQEQFNLFYKNQSLQGFDNSLLQEQKQWINRYLRNQGYQKISIDFQLHENQDSSKNLQKKISDNVQIIDVTWNISLHESEVKFGKTIILGNNLVPYSSVMKEVAYKYGENWDKQKIQQTLKNIKELNIFQSVQIYPSKDTDNLLYKPIFMKLIHADRYEVRTRFGLQQVGNNLQLRRGFTYKVGASLYLKNLFNIADQGFVEADVTKFYRNIAACYEFPWLFGKRIRCQFKVYDSLYEQPVYIGSKNSLYTATQQGFLWNMSHVFPSVTVSGSTGCEFMGIKQADQHMLGSIIDYDPTLLGKKPSYLFFEPNVIWQKVDNLLNPNRGHLSFISCKGMFDLNSKTSFLKLLIEHSEYISILNSATLALRLRGGHVFNRKFNQLIPIERFYLGGASSLRAYQRDYCPPLGRLTEPIYDQHAGLPPQADNLWRYAPQGGRTMINFNIEMRMPIYKNLGGAVFIDSGALFKNSVFHELKNKSDNFFAGSGFGIRYDTPIGPLRFDCSFKWKKQYQDFESWCVWYLTLGQAF